MSAADPIALAQALIRCPSVTPRDEGALGVLEAALKPLGFTCHRLSFGEGEARVENLYARRGDSGPNFCFAGHTDVVPVGDAKSWKTDPFAAEIRDGTLYGRGATDMKSAIAAFVAATARHLETGNAKGSISLLITGDEEGPAINGTDAVLKWLSARKEKLDHCVVGEPTATAKAGDTIKIGRRGSMRVVFTARGLQGHTAYPDKAKNPIPALGDLAGRLGRIKLDAGNDHFQASTLAFTTFDVGNPAGNVSPAEAKAACNIRFNDVRPADAIIADMKALAATVAKGWDLAIDVEARVTAHAFVTKPGAFIDLVSSAIARATNERPVLSTTGGTSDARFIKNLCPVAEVGVPGTTMHKVDECVPLSEIHRLTDIYAAILDDYFFRPPA